MRLKSPFEITRFSLFQKVNRNFFRLKYEQRARSFLIFFAELGKEKGAGNLEYVSKQPLKKPMSSISYTPHSFDKNDEEIVKKNLSLFIFYHLFSIINLGSVCEIVEY